MAIIIQDCEVPQNCAGCIKKVGCTQRIYMEERPDGCPIIAMPEECMECVRTKFRAAIKCGEWAKMNATRNGQEYTIKCPMYHIFKANIGEDDDARDSDAL